ncbi:MAG: hypothetical protein ABI898_07170 [Sphingomonadales bacterium]
MTDIPARNAPAPNPCHQRHDGWTPERQCIFLDDLATCGMVRHAAISAHMSHEAAYKLRHRSDGSAFRVGWDAALLLARVRLADTLMERALEGQEDVVVRDNYTGTRTRRRHDNRLALSLLARLDRLAVKPQAVPDGDTLAADDHGDARVVAGAWEAFLDLVANGADAAALDAFLTVHRPVAPLPETASGPCQLHDPEDADDSGHAELLESYTVWWDAERDDYRTNFPPPPGFNGDEEGEIDEDYTGWPDYHRSLTPREAVYVVAFERAHAEKRCAEVIARRRKMFGLTEGDDEVGEGKTFTVVREEELQEEVRDLADA